ncbi:MAG: molybdopterin-dependent oxidoreductase [bacterium]
MRESTPTEQKWQPTACIICSLNCGIEVQIENGHLTRIRGDESHPLSRGYLCQKATRLDYYQNHNDRLHHPLRRKQNGSFERISWQRAIDEIAAKIVEIRDRHGGHALAYYGGGGQGNHLCGVYGGALRAGMRTRYLYNSLAQEKTGDFWVNGKLFGKQTCHISESVEEADYVVFLGKNPWQSHGFSRARKVLQAIAKDPARTMVVIDPRKTETARMADVHLQLRPGTDAFLLTAILATIIQEGWQDDDFIKAHTTGFASLRRILDDIPVPQFSNKAGIDSEHVRAVARGLSGARSATVCADLGIQQSLHSTLNSYLEKLLFLITGNFGRRGTNNLHTALMPLVGHSKEPEEGGCTTRVTGMQEISKFFPPNILPAEIDTDHPERIRGLVVESSNPMVSAADTTAYREAFKKLELLVVIDVANSETARLAHYVLPASTQFEKWETTFFTLNFPTQAFHLRRPILTPGPDTLAEPEIHRRLLVAMGELPEKFPVLEKLARLDRRFPKLRIFPAALAALLRLRPGLRPYSSLILHETLGAALPNGAKAAAPLWGAAHFYAARYPQAVRQTGLEGKGRDLGEALFNRILLSESGALISTHNYDDVWRLIKHADGKIHLEISEMLSALRDSRKDLAASTNPEHPFILMAGERRSYNANAIFRDPAWRKNDPDGALRIHPEDAATLGLSDGDWSRCESARSAIDIRVKLDDGILKGVVSMPHGYGLDYTDASPAAECNRTGPYVNLLTSTEHADPIAKTPYHKYLPVKLSKLDR